MPKRLIQNRVRISIVDDDEDMRSLLRDILQPTREFICVGCFSSATEALSELPGLRPDLVLMDIRMPLVGGIECTRRLKQILPPVKIIMVTGMHDPSSIEEAIQAGADDYLIKPITPDQCLAALKFAIARRRRRETTSKKGKCTVKLTPRANEVMRLLARGLLYKEIADKLRMSYSAVHKHQHKIFQKLRAGDRSEAIHKWREAGGD